MSGLLLYLLEAIFSIPNPHTNQLRNLHCGHCFGNINGWVSRGDRQGGKLEGEKNVQIFEVEMRTQKVTNTIKKNRKA